MRTNVRLFSPRSCAAPVACSLARFSTATILMTLALVAVGWWQHKMGEEKGIAAGENTALRASGYATLAAGTI
jgi:hypothetical protein